MLKFEQIFQITLIEQNTAAQENIKKALVDAYAQAVNTRRYIQDILQRRTSTISSLMASSDSYDDLLSKANKGIEFYTKLETNVSKLLQRIKSTFKVQQEEREQVLGTAEFPVAPKTDDTSGVVAPKLKDYLESRKRNPVTSNYPDPNIQYPQPAASYGVNMEYPPGIRPTPVGSEFTTDLPKTLPRDAQNYMQYNYNYQQPSNTSSHFSEEDNFKKMKSLHTNPKDIHTQNYPQYSFNNYVPQNYSSTNYSQANETFSSGSQSELNSPYDSSKAFTTTTNSYRSLQTSATAGFVQYPDGNLNSTAAMGVAGNYQYQNIPHSAPPGMDRNVNVYYPHGYAPNQGMSNNSDGQHVSGDVKYHSVEYATSVQPNITTYNQNAIYSSPISNMSSTNSMEPNNKVTNDYYYPMASISANSSIASLPGSGQMYNSQGISSCSSTSSYYSANSFAVAGQPYPATSEIQQYSQVSVLQ